MIVLGVLQKTEREFDGLLWGIAIVGKRKGGRELLVLREAEGWWQGKEREKDY